MSDWQVITGDCLEVMRGMDAGSVDAVITDPPYGRGFNTDYRRFTGGVSKPQFAYARIANDDRPFNPAPFINFAPTVVMFGANNYSDRLPQGSWLVWDKRLGQKPLMTSDGEVAWCNRGHGVYIFNHVWDGFLRGPEQGIKRVHPTQKPIALMAWIIKKYTNPGDLILDPFCGSGTTGVACVQTGRRFIGIEIDEGYATIARERIARAAEQARLLELL